MLTDSQQVSSLCRGKLKLGTTRPHRVRIHPDDFWDFPERYAFKKPFPLCGSGRTDTTAWTKSATQSFIRRVNFIHFDFFWRPAPSFFFFVHFLYSLSRPSNWFIVFSFYKLDCSASEHSPSQNFWTNSCELADHWLSLWTNRQLPSSSVPSYSLTFDIFLMCFYDHCMLN